MKGTGGVLILTILLVACAALAGSMWWNYRQSESGAELALLAQRRAEAALARAAAAPPPEPRRAAAETAPTGPDSRAAQIAQLTQRLVEAESARARERAAADAHARELEARAQEWEASVAALKLQLSEAESRAAKLAAAATRPASAPTVAVMPAPPASAIETRLRADITAMLERSATGGSLVSNDIPRLAARRWLLPLLAEHFRDPARTGVIAVEACLALDDLTLADLLDAAGRSGPSTAEFVEATAKVIDALLARGADLAPVVAAAQDPAAPGGSRLPALLVLARRGDSVTSTAARASLAGPGPERAQVIEFLLHASDAGRRALIDACTSGTLERGDIDRVLPRLLSDARTSEVGDLARLVANLRHGFAVARTAAVGAETKRALVAALLAEPRLDDEGITFLAEVMGLDPAAGRRAVMARAMSDPVVVEALRQAAHQLGRGALADTAALRERAKVAGPADVPDLVDAFDLVAPDERAGVAGVAARLGHADGSATLRRLAHHLDPAVRRAVHEAIARERLDDLGDVVAAGFDDPDEEVMMAALEAAAALNLAVEPARGVAALEYVRAPFSWDVLDALRRCPAQANVLSLLMEALERDAVRDPWGAAQFVVEVGGKSGGDPFLVGLLRHSQAAVRARALLALARSAGAAQMLSSFDGIADDSDFAVRAAAAAALGQVKDDLARARLVNMARDPSFVVRESALWALGRQERVHVVPVLRRALGDPDPAVRNAARLALIEHGVRDVVPGVADDLDEPWAAGRTATALKKLLPEIPADRADLRTALEEVSH